jgi:hypothetical protein
VSSRGRHGQRLLEFLLPLPARFDCVPSCAPTWLSSCSGHNEEPGDVQGSLRVDGSAPKLQWVCEIRLCEIQLCIRLCSKRMPLNAVEAGDKEEDDGDCHGH